MIRGLLVGALAAVTLVACGDESTGPGDLAPVASLEITSNPDTLLTRQRLKLEVRAFDSQGSLLSDRPLAWESAEPAIASVTAGGVVTAVTPGTTVIRARAQDVADSVTVTTRTLLLDHVYVGVSRSCGLEASGEAWCWGNVGPNGYGNGSLDSTRRDVPARAAVGHAFASLALARTSACGIEVSGSVLCWGENESGQLGDGSATAHGTPTPVSGLIGIVQLAAGDSHFCALSNGGGVSCWGRNEELQTGQPTRGLTAQARSVALVGPASEITAGWGHSCALVAGQSFCWGDDGGGQLGNDTTYDRLAPVLAATGDGANRTWSEVEASNLHNCGRDTSGTVFCWGFLEGDADSLLWLPTPRLQGIVATDLANGWFVQCVVSDQQRAWCAGRGHPGIELAAPGPVTSVVVAGGEACVLQNDGAVACELGTTQPGTLAVVPLPAPAVQLAATDNQACALDNVAAVYCWSTWDRLEPQQVFQSLTVTALYGNSGRRMCVLTQTTVVGCRDTYEETETTEPTGSLSLVSLAAGDNHACGLTSAGAAWCWGENTHGQLGDGTTTDRPSPVAVHGGHVFSQITASWGFTCGVTTAGPMYCWGYGSSGNIGDDRRDQSAAPVDVDGAPVLTQLGGNAGCGLDASGSVWCWPTSFDTRAAHQITGATGLVSTTGPCGLRPTGEMLCWGYNLAGSFGDGTYDISRPAAVPGGSNILFTEVGFGLWGSACGIALDGGTYCWGNAIGTSLGSPESSGELATLPLKLYGSP